MAVHVGSRIRSGRMVVLRGGTRETPKFCFIAVVTGGVKWTANQSFMAWSSLRITFRLVLGSGATPRGEKKWKIKNLKSAEKYHKEVK